MQKNDSKKIIDSKDTLYVYRDGAILRTVYLFADDSNEIYFSLVNNLVRLLELAKNTPTIVNDAKWING